LREGKAAFIIREARRLLILSIAVFAIALSFVGLWTISTSYHGHGFGENLLIAGMGIIAIGVLIPAVEPRPEYTRNAYVTPGTHYMKVYPRQSTTPNLSGESLAWKKQAGLSRMVAVSLAMILSGLLLMATSLVFR